MLCRRASIGFSIFAVNVAAAILETEYVPSKLNIVCDGLSRGKWLGFVGTFAGYGRSCVPRLPLTTWSQVIDHMGQCHQLLSRI